MDKPTIQTYNQQAKEYDDETIDFWERFPRTVLDKFAGLTTGQVLDIGSGPGRDGLLLQERGLDVFCLDASETMIRMCAERGLAGVVANFDLLPFQDKVFGGVWAYTSLLHVPKSEIGQALGEIRRVLADDGIFGLGMISGDTEEYKETTKVTQPRWFSFYTQEELEKLLAHFGFEVVYFETFQPGSKVYLNYILRKMIK